MKISQPSELTALLAKVPVVASTPSLMMGTLKHLCVLDDYKVFRESVDSPGRYLPEEPTLILSETSESPFPVLNLEEGLILQPEKISESLFDNFSLFKKLFLTQSGINSLISKFVHKDCIILVVVDGLSYFDCLEYDYIKPCLVEGLSLTKQGFLSIFGKPTIAQSLFDTGFAQRYGFTYWNRDIDKEITNRVFFGFSPEQLFQVKEFDCAVSILRKKNLYKSYVQIVVEGLDGLCHNTRDRPLVKPHVERIFSRLNELEEVLKLQKLSALIIMTSDHGILWDVKKLVVKNDPVFKDSSGKRWTSGAINRDYLRVVSQMGRKFSLLKYPYITRKVASTEWGVHGGISAWETVVPLYMKEVKP